MISAEEFEQLYHEFWGLVYSICLAYLHDKEEAEDAAMEVFVRKWCAIDRYDPAKASFKAWLVSNTNHLCIDLLRKSSRLQVERIDELPEEDVADSPIPNADATDLSLAMARLSPLDRQLVIMRIVEEYTWQEIAQVTGLTVAQVRGRVDAALARLRKWLGAKDEVSTRD